MGRTPSKKSSVEIGEKYHYLTVISKSYSKEIVTKRGITRLHYAKFRCDCGTEKEISCYSVRSSKTKSCSNNCRSHCYRIVPGIVPLDRQKVKIGEVYGYLVVVEEPFYKSNNSDHFVKCKCKCTNSVIVLCYMLTGHRTKSCGCLHKEILKKRIEDGRKLKYSGDKRECSSCKEYKTLDLFHKDKERYDGYSCSCKECAYLGHVRRRYKLSKEDYQKLVKMNKNKCMICGRGPKKKRLQIDHCHKNGKIRGLLCNNCNLGLGNFLDNPEILKNAAKYLEENS